MVSFVLQQLIEFSTSRPTKPMFSQMPVSPLSNRFFLSRGKPSEPPHFRGRLTHLLLLITAAPAVVGLAVSFLLLQGPLRAEAPKQAFPTLPDPLVTEQGDPVTTVEQWETERRPHTLELFRQLMFGRAPVARPDSLSFEIVREDPEAMGGAALFREVAIRFEAPRGAGKITLYVFYPNAVEQPVPVFLLICHRDPSNIDPTREVREDFWPAEEIVGRGYAAAAFHVSDLDPDEHDDFKNGVHGLYEDPDQARAQDAWGALTAWAWGASRAMDYLETDARVAADRVAVVGHSRGGKTSLWAGARDERFGLMVSNNAGANGAALARNRKGERIAYANRKFPHWFAENYKQFGNDPWSMPFDQHQLVALSAPRHVYIASAEEDYKADPQGEFLSAYFASPVWELYGYEGLAAEEQPPADRPVHSGHIAYHLRSGGHDLTLQDWNWFMDYADTIWK